MKTIRNITILVGLSVALFAMGATGARGEVPYSTHLAGMFTLPFKAQWGKLTLPAGDYTLQYGTEDNGQGLVVVRGMAKGSPYGMILAGPTGQTSATKNALVCVREGKRVYIRELQMGAIAQSASFKLPHGVKVRAWVVASKGNHNSTTQIAEVLVPIERVSPK
jgi:hypothetical protein